MTAIDLLYARRRRASRAQSAQLEQYAFHGTSKANLRAIRAVGLLPMNGQNTTNDEGHDAEAKVCFALNKSTAKKYAGKDGVIIQVDLDEPEVAGACPQSDKFTNGGVTVNRRIPPEAIKVLKAAEGRGLRLLRLGEGYARDRMPTAQVSEVLKPPSAEEIAVQNGFIQDYQMDHGDLGKVTRFFHPRGDRLIVSTRHNLHSKISQNAHYTDRLKGVSGNWISRWEYHSLDGVKSTGYDLSGLEAHIQRSHGAQTA